MFIAEVLTNWQSYLAVTEPIYAIHTAVEAELGNEIWVIILALGLDHPNGGWCSKIQLEILVPIFS